MPATLHAIFGPCGAGKTTYAYALARRERAVPFVLDDWGARLFGLVAFVLTACGHDDAPVDARGNDAAAGEQKMQACGDTRDCTVNDEGCAQFPYEELPQRCFDICYSHYCCSNTNGVWGRETYDCALPVDAGVDAR